MKTLLIIFMLVMANLQAEQKIKLGETVLVKNESVVFTTSSGTMKVTAGDKLQRTYTWNGESRSLEMEPREKEWYGSYGVYNPGDGEFWKNHHGVTRGVTEEGILRFENLSGLKDSIKKDRLSYMEYAYIKDGIIGGWHIVLERKQLNCEVWKILIDGKNLTTEQWIEAKKTKRMN